MPFLCSESPFEFCDVFRQFSLHGQPIPAVHHTLTVEVPSHLQFGPQHFQLIVNTCSHIKTFLRAAYRNISTLYQKSVQQNT